MTCPDVGASLYLSFTNRKTTSIPLSLNSCKTHSIPTFSISHYPTLPLLLSEKNPPTQGIVSHIRHQCDKSFLFHVRRISIRVFHFSACECSDSFDSMGETISETNQIFSLIDDDGSMRRNRRLFHNSNGNGEEQREAFRASIRSPNSLAS